MSTRTVKQYSDRGKIKDLSHHSDVIESHINAVPFENRMKKLFEYAQDNKDKKLLSSLGFITTDYISDKNALPLSIYRIRKIVDEIKSKSGNQIDYLTQQFSSYIISEINPEGVAYFAVKRAITKTASINKKSPIFRRVSKS